jgi:hypothetical protein
MRPQRAAATVHIPRPLWPSTSTKNPDTRNVDSMFGLDTPNTLREATMAVFEDQGRLAPEHRRQCCDRRGHDATTRRSA